MSFSILMRVSLGVVGVWNGVLLHLHHWKTRSQQLVSSPLSTFQKDIPTTLTKSRKSRFLRATPSGYVSLTLTLKENMIPSQSLTKMAQDLDSLTEGRTLTMTGGRRLSATRTQLKFCSTLMAAVHTRVG